MMMVIGLVSSLIRNAPGLGTLAAGAATARHAFRRIVSQGLLHNELRGILQGKNQDLMRIDLQFAGQSKAWDQKRLVQSFLKNRISLDRDAVGMHPLSPVPLGERSTTVQVMTSANQAAAKQAARNLAKQQTRRQNDAQVT